MVFETEMNKPITNYFNNCFSYSEVPIDNRKIDWVFLDKTNSEIIAVELKIRNWKRLLKQALSNTFCSHKSYAAIWHEYANNVKLDWFKQYGIGFLLVHENKIEEILKPESNIKEEMTESMKMVFTWIKDMDR